MCFSSVQSNLSFKLNKDSFIIIVRNIRVDKKPVFIFLHVISICLYLQPLVHFTKQCENRVLALLPGMSDCFVRVQVVQSSSRRKTSRRVVSLDKVSTDTRLLFSSNSSMTAARYRIPPVGRVCLRSCCPPLCTKTILTINFLLPLPNTFVHGCSG